MTPIPSGSYCNLTSHMDLIDFAYLSACVYHNQDTESRKIIGREPYTLKDATGVNKALRDQKYGWYQIYFPGIALPRPKSGFYADLYAKITKNKIEHFAIAFRGTTYDLSSGDIDDLKTDFKTWYQTAISQFYLDKTSDSPDFSAYIKARIAGFILRVSDVVAELKAEKLIADRPQFWLTGHSLGGALAHYALTHSVAKGNLFRSVAFNPPGIGEIPGSHTQPALADRALTIRARYDFISMVGRTYGHVLTFQVPEHYKEAQAAYDHHAQKNEPANWSSEPITTLPTYTAIQTERHLLEKTQDLLQTAGKIEMTQEFLTAIMGQHGMTNLLRTIASEPSRALLDFNQLQKLAGNHIDTSPA